MTIIKKSVIAAAVILAVQAQANAAQYSVTGNLAATKVVGATAIPVLTLTLTQPSFSSLWDIDTNTSTVVGGLDFDPYSVAIKAIGI